MIDLQQLYLQTLCGLFADRKLTAVQQTIAENSGRLFLVRDGTTVPDAIVQYQFDLDEIKLAIATRDGRNKPWIVKYAEGLDGVLPEVSRFMDGNRIADKRKAA